MSLWRFFSLVFFHFWIECKTAFCIEPVFEHPHRGCYLANWAKFRTGMSRYTINDVDPTVCTYITLTGGKIEDQTLTLDTPSDTGQLIQKSFRQILNQNK
jgi:hypothetical protein